MASMLSWITGSSSSNKRKAAPKDAIVALRAHLEMLQKREIHLQNQMDEQEAIARKNVSSNKTAARAALKRKKQHEHSLEQTTAQIATLEQQIYSIEAANINQETLKAMQKAGKAMKEIHGGLTIDKVDETMDQLREQHALGEEIANAITSAPIGETIDQDELEDELANMEQEALDEKMLKTGSVPVADSVHRLPAAVNTEVELRSARTTAQRAGKLPAYAAPAVAAEDDDEEAELAKLQAEMAM
ncbi:MAG: ESCRT-III subunit protein snf7 [Phylliscum demangeonii]|nr:MAG: ESCRT-III subunit protein snf7 [Phylliscum demangeonii]